MDPELATTSDALSEELVPIPDDAADVCPLCRSGRTRPTRLCFSCEATSGHVGFPCPVVIPISYYTTPSPLRERMHDFKEAESEKVRALESRNVASVASRYVAEHADRLAEVFGPWDRTVAVPSTHHSDAPALQVAIETNFPDPFAPFERPLTYNSDSNMRFRQADEDGFLLDPEIDIAGRRYMLIDDTFTTGARVQSAHHALIAAGAAVPVIVIVTRKINPDATYGTDQLWARQSSVPFEFGSVQWWDSA
jgi:predicted amidophosphoribosyltransferase